MHRPTRPVRRPKTDPNRDNEVINGMGDARFVPKRTTSSSLSVLRENVITTVWQQRRSRIARVFCRDQRKYEFKAGATGVCLGKTQFTAVIFNYSPADR